MDPGVRSKRKLKEKTKQPDESNSSEKRKKRTRINPESNASTVLESDENADESMFPQSKVPPEFVTEEAIQTNSSSNSYDIYMSIDENLIDVGAYFGLQIVQCYLLIQYSIDRLLSYLSRKILIFLLILSDTYNRYIFRTDSTECS